MNVTVTVDGEEHDVDVTLDRLTLQESCDVEDALGEDGWDRYTQGRLSPKVIRAVLWAKLRRQFPDLTVDDFDIALTDVDDDGDDPGPFDGS